MKTQKRCHHDDVTEDANTVAHFINQQKPFVNISEKKRLRKVIIAQFQRCAHLNRKGLDSETHNCII